MFQASHFADVSGAWGVSFTVWQEGSSKAGVAPLDVKDVRHFTVVKIGSKRIYNADGREASKWVRSQDALSGTHDGPQLKSGLQVHDVITTTPVASGTLGYLHSNSNSLANSATLTFWLSAASSDGHGTPVSGANYRRCVALFAARRRRRNG